MEPVPYNVSAPVYPKGCISAAWDDIKASPNYVSRLLLLGLIACVPILNFVVMGYLLLWSREVPLGRRTPLPQKMVTGKTFEFGFYAFVLSLVVSIVSGLVSGILGWIPLIGWVVSIAVMLIAIVAQGCMQIRMIMGLSLGEGFNIKDIWEKGQRNWGQLILVTVVPPLVIGAIVSVAAFAIMMLCMLLGLGGAIPAMMELGSTAGSSLVPILSIMGSFAGPLLGGILIVYIGASIAEVVAEALTVRALGHWVARYAPEWAALDPQITW